MGMPGANVAGGDGEARPRRGRVRDASRDDALRRATFELLAEVGYERLTMDAIAARAGAGKATVYRRWASKADLVIDAVHHRSHASILPDTGSLRGDLEALACARQANEDEALMTRARAGLMTALLSDAEFRQAFREGTQPANQLTAVFERAVERGEIPPRPDLELVTSLLPAIGFYRLMMFDEQPSPEFASMVLERVILPLLTGSPPGPQGRTP